MNTKLNIISVKLFRIFFYLTVIFGAIGCFLYYGFFDSSGCCTYWTNNLARNIVLPISFVFLVSIVACVIFGAMGVFTEEKVEG